MFPEEEEITKNFSFNRLREFSIGRYCARIALQQAGITSIAILKAKDGFPLWPENCIGSIAHTNNCTAAVVTNTRLVKSIGIDMEEINRFPLEIKAQILRSDEIKSYEQFKLLSAEKKLALFFSIKEAVYKAANPVFHEFLEFQDVKVELNKSNFSYEAYVYKLTDVNNLNNRCQKVYGKFVFDEYRVYTTAWF